jgi:hypothetical protein
MRAPLWRFAAHAEDLTLIWTAKLFIALAFSSVFSDGTEPWRRGYAGRGFWGKKQRTTL